MKQHPDQRFATYILRGLTYGFRIGSNTTRNATDLKSAAYSHPEVLSSQLENELLASRLIKTDATSHTHISPLGLIPKPGQPGKWRLIMDLSAPRGRSINDSINPDLCSLKYATVDQALLFLQILGPGAQLAKMDLKSAYRMVPVHPDDQHLLGLKWEGVVYRDTSLLFGLRSAPKIFSAVADSLAWAMTCNGATNFLHYLDDFLFMARPLRPSSATPSTMHYQLARN